MLRNIFALLLPLISNLLMSQNLVQNPDFEQVKKQDYPACRYIKSAKQFNNAVAYWNTFNLITPDFIKVDLEDSTCIYPKPHSGHHMVGIINYHPGADSGYDFDYHEFIQGRLKAPLKPGQTYEIEIWIQQTNQTAVDHLNSVFSSNAKVIPGASNNLGIRFEMDAESPTVIFRNVIRDFGIKPHVNFDQVIETKEGEWRKISVTFIPRQPFRFFIIGNFFSDFRTETSIEKSDEIENFNHEQNGFYKKVKRIAYYCLDDISIHKYEPALEESIEANLTENSRYTFRNVNFETNRWDLNEGAKKELDALAKYLQDNPSISIEIGGHTDNIGKEERNQILSEKRAEAVYGYLSSILKAEGQISYKGYGESKPIANNETAAGRLKNRRVECLILD